MKTEDLDYSGDGLTFRGYLAYDDTNSAPRPGVLILHEAWGLTRHVMERARMLADLGYVALAADLFGGRRQITDPAEARPLMAALRADPSALRGRAQAGLAALAAQPLVDPLRLAAIGFCFGGMTALELARDGAALAGAVSFHGGLETSAPAAPGAVKAKILVLTGADDPMIPPDQVVAFEEEMRQAGTDWQVVAYGGAVHGFMNRWAAVTLPGVRHDARTEIRAWAAMNSFFGEIFGA